VGGRQKYYQIDAIKSDTAIGLYIFPDRHYHVCVCVCVSVEQWYAVYIQTSLPLSETLQVSF